MSPSARSWFDLMLFGLRELFSQAETSEQIGLAVDAVQEVWRLESEAAA